jgi:hypothetical protein
MDEDKWFRLYLAMRSEHFEALKQHGEHFSHYLTLVMAVLTVTGAAVFQLHEARVCPVAVGGVALTGSVINIALCYVAIKVCNRYYEAFLEAVTVMAKLESSLHLEARPLGAGSSTDASGPFPKDVDLFPGRYRKARARYSTEARFVRAATCKGVNLLVMLTMGLLALANLVVCLGAVAVINGRWSI